MQLRKTEKFRSDLPPLVIVIYYRVSCCFSSFAHHRMTAGYAYSSSSSKQYTRTAETVVASCRPWVRLSVFFFIFSEFGFRRGSNRYQHWSLSVETEREREKGRISFRPLCLAIITFLSVSWFQCFACRRGTAGCTYGSDQLYTRTAETVVDSSFFFFFRAFCHVNSYSITSRTLTRTLVTYRQPHIMLFTTHYRLTKVFTYFVADNFVRISFV